MVLNMRGFQISQICAYGSITQGSEYGWIWLIDARINCFDHSDDDIVLNMPGQSLTRLWICEGFKGLRLEIWQGCKYGRVTKGAKCNWMSLKIP